MALTTQATVLAVILGLLAIGGLVTSIVQKQFGLDTILGLLITVPILALMVYDTHCLTRGQCEVWSWIRTILYAILPTIAIIFTIVALVKKSKKTEEENAKTA